MNTAIQKAPASELAEAKLISLDPVSYVAAVYKPFRQRLDEVRAAAAAVSYDIATTAGMKLATEWRARIRAIRIEGDKAREARKAPVLEIGRLLDSRYKDLKAEIEPLEERFHQDIKAEEDRKEAERQARIAAELARVNGIQARIQAIRNHAVAAAGKTSGHIAQALTAVQALSIDESFDEFLQYARDAQTATIVALTALHGESLQQEAEALRIQAERKELAQLRKAQAEQEAERLKQRQIGAQGPVAVPPSTFLIGNGPKPRLRLRDKPPDAELIGVLVRHYQVDISTVCSWIANMLLKEA